jgi:hypothetical protein
MTSHGTLKGRVIALTALTVALAAGAGVLGSDALLNRGFGHALEASRPSLSFDATGPSVPAQGTTVGDEGFWLTRAEMQSPAPFAKPLAIGDRITIAGRDGRERHLEVVDMKTLGGDAARSLRSAGIRLMLVTCRVTGEGADRTEAPVRFMVEAEPSAPPLPPPAKAL